MHFNHTRSIPTLYTPIWLQNYIFTPFTTCLKEAEEDRRSGILNPSRVPKPGCALPIPQASEVTFPPVSSLYSWSTTPKSVYLSPNSACPRPRCPGKVDIHGDHLFHCKYGSLHIKRHDAQGVLLASDMFKPVMHPVIEPRHKGANRTRPDISAIGLWGGIEFFDVTIFSPLTDSASQVRQINPLTSLNMIHSAKWGDAGTIFDTTDRIVAWFLF